MRVLGLVHLRPSEQLGTFKVQRHCQAHENGHRGRDETTFDVGDLVHAHTRPLGELGLRETDEGPLLTDARAESCEER